MTLGAKSRVGVHRMGAAITFALALLTVASSTAAERERPDSPLRSVRIDVFSLFKPKVLRMMPASDSLDGDGVAAPLLIEFNGRAEVLPSETQAVIEIAPSGMIRVTAGFLHGVGSGLRAFRSHTDHPEGEAFWLEVPGKLRRRFTGSVEIRSDGISLQAIVTMPLETAVASVVQAESPPGAPIEALKAQAIAARSFLVARQSGHIGFDFCDTTHCQFLRSPPAQGSPAANAVKSTEGLILTWHDDAAAEDRTLAAMYARSCGGRTRTLREIGVSSTGYPYYAVRCTFCSRHPGLWKREVRSQDGTLTERERLAFNRIHGWSAIPSLPQASSDLQTREVVGRGVGHGLGLCQLGAVDMARRGAGYGQILAHYYPNTKVTILQTQ